jgi:PAS domain S-box-containing protein
MAALSVLNKNGRQKIWHFLLGGFLLFILFNYFYYRWESSEVVKEKYSLLSIISHIKHEQIDDWKKKRLYEAEFLSSLNDQVQSAKILFNNSSDSKSINYLDNLFSPTVSYKNYENIFLAAENGKIIYSYLKDFSTIDTSTAHLINFCIKNDSIVFSDFYYCPTHKNIHLDIIAPVRNSNGKPFAALLFRIDPDSYLIPMLNRWPTDSKTAESMLIKKEGDHLRILSRTKRESNAAIGTIIKLSNTDRVGVKGVLGVKGAIEGIDYRNQQVIADAKHLEGTNWYLITKMDREEVLDEIYNRVSVLAIISFIFIGLITTVAIVVYRLRQAQVYRDLFYKEKKLNEYQAQTKAITDAAQDAIIMIDENGKITFWNPAAEKILGYNIEEVMGKNLHRIIAPEAFHPLHFESFENFRKDGKGNAIGNVLEFVAVKKDKTEVPIELSLSGMKSNGKWNAVGIIRDITERKNAEYNLKESEEKFRKAFVTSPDSININRMKDGLYVSVNEGFLKMTGYSENEVIGKTSYELNIWNHVEDRENVIKKLMSDGRIENYEAQFKLKDGTLKYALMSATIISLNDEPHILSITRDITERKAIESALRQSEQNNKQIINGMKDAVFVIDFNGRVIDVNKAAEDVLGYTREELLQLTPHDFDDSLSNEEIKTLIANMPVDLVQSFQTTHISKSRKRIPVQITSSIIYYQGNKAILSIARDISSWLKAQEIIYKNEALLTETQKLAKIGGWEFNVETNEMFWTEECYKIHGVDPRDFENGPKDHIAKSILCYDEEDRKEVMEVFNNCVNEGVPYDLEFPFTNFKNERIWIRTIAQPQFVDSKVVKVVGNIMDITERVEVLNKLKRSERRFRELFESMEEGFYLAELVYDANGKPVDCKYIDVNPAHRKITDLQRNDVVGKTLSQLFPGLEHEWVDAHIEVAVTGKPKTMEGYVGSLGKYYILHMYSPRQGQCAVLFSDITDRRVMEEKLKESEERYSRIVNTANEGIWMMDADHKTTYINSRMKEMLGYDESVIISKKVEDFMLPEDLPAHFERMKGRYKGESSTYEHRFMRKDGSIIHTIVSGVSLKDNDGKFIGSFGMFTDITKRKFAEEALRKSEERWQFAIEGSDDGVWDWNVKTGEIYFSSKWKSMLGYKDDEIKNDLNEWENRLHPEDAGGVLKAVEEHLAGKTEYYSSEHRMMCKDGSYIWILDRGKVLVKDADGKPERMVGTHKDITESRIAEQALMESEERFRSIVEGAPDAIFIQADHKIVFANSQFYTLLGYKSAEEIKGKLILDHIHPDFRELVTQRIKKLNIDHKSVNELRELKLLKTDGSDVWIESKGEPIVFNNNNGALVFIRDITERKNAEEAIRQSESKFYSLYENSPNAIFISEPETYTIIDCNQNACLMNGYTKEELIGQNLNILHPDELIQESLKYEVKEYNLEILRNQKSITIESLHKKKDGTVFPIESSISLITLNGKELTMGIDRDISERKIIEKELAIHRDNLEELVKVRTKEIEWINKELISEIEKKQQTEILLKQSLEKEKELNQLKSRFISTASHEFRTPLTTILSSAELIQRYGKRWDDEKYTDHMMRITNSVEYLTNLMDDVLTISRIESGRISFAPVKTNLEELSLKVIDDIKLSYEQKHKLDFKYQSEEKYFSVDPKQMQMIIQNLLTNAFKYSDPDDKIELLINTDEDNLFIKVTDDGMGIDQKDILHIFEPFYRSINTENIQGTGLGLSIVKNAVEMHNGKINVTSQLGQGATFLITLPKGTA